MKACPAVNCGGGIVSFVLGVARVRVVIDRVITCSMVGTKRHGASVVPGEIYQFPMNLCRRQCHDFPGRFNRDFAEASIQPKDGVLIDVVRVLPAFH